MMLPMVIQLIDNDDDRAWMTALYEKECRVMFRTVQAYSNQKADTEDIVSESCVVRTILNVMKRQTFIAPF